MNKLENILEKMKNINFLDLFIFYLESKPPKKIKFPNKTHLSL